MNKITVLGDAFVDVWMVGKADRKSAEQDGLNIYDIQSIRRQAGGAHHVANAITELAEPGTTVLPEFDYDNLPVKSRIVVDGTQVCRFDCNDKCQPSNVYSDTIKDNVVVIIDYGKGSINNGIVKKILDSHPRQLWINTKSPLTSFKCLDMDGESTGRFTCDVRFVCNQEEYTKDQDFYFNQEKVYVTSGPKGISYLYSPRDLYATRHVNSFKALSDTPVSVCGAGDVVLAALVTTPVGYNELMWAMSAAAESVETPFTGNIHKSRVVERYLAQCQKL